MAFVLQRFDFLADEAGFFFRIPRAGQRWFFAFLVIGEERFTQAALIMGYEFSGGGQDVAG